MLTGSGRLEGRLDGTELVVGLPPGDVQRFRLASSLDASDLTDFGLWRILPPVLTANVDIIEAAADGWLWALHPLRRGDAGARGAPAPRCTPRHDARPRSPGGRRRGRPRRRRRHPWAQHGVARPRSAGGPIPSTTSTSTGGRTGRRPGVAFTTTIRPEEDLAVLVGGFKDVPRDRSRLRAPLVHRAVHVIGDTRHHTMRYRFRATTRFREYFDAGDPGARAVPAGPIDPARPVDDGKSVVGPEIVVNVPSSARPAAPIVHSALPLFRWDEGTEPEQPVAVRRRRRAGVRLYLRAAVVLLRRGRAGRRAARARRPRHRPARPGQPMGRRIRCGRARPVAQRGVLGLDNLVHLLGFDDRPSDAGPVRPPATHPLDRGSRGAGCDRARLRAPVQPGSWAVVRRHRHRSRQHVLAVRAPRDRPVPARQRDRLPPLEADPVRLRAADARAHRERQPHRCPPRAGGGQWAGRRAVPAGRPTAVAGADDAGGARRLGRGSTARSSPACSSATRCSRRPISGGRPSPPPSSPCAATVATCSRRPGSAPSSPRTRTSPSTGLATTKTGA